MRDDRSHPPVVLGPIETPVLMGAVDEATLPVASLAIGVARGGAVQANAGAIDPAQCAVIGDVLEQQAMTVAYPHRPLDPTEPRGQLLQPGVRQHERRKLSVQRFDCGRHSFIHRNAQGQLGPAPSSCTTMSTAGSSPTVPDRWPLRPVVGRVC